MVRLPHVQLFDLKVQQRAIVEFQLQQSSIIIVEFCDRVLRLIIDTFNPLTRFWSTFTTESDD